MTDYKKLVKALRSKFIAYDVTGNHNSAQLYKDAADAIVALGLDNEDYEHENRRLHGEIEALQAQLPKRGEWKTTDAFPHRVYCSKCFRTYVPNDRWQIWVDNELPRNYCPNCGAKMMEVQDDKA